MASSNTPTNSLPLCQSHQCHGKKVMDQRSYYDTTRNVCIVEDKESLKCMRLEVIRRVKGYCKWRIRFLYQHLVHSEVLSARII